MEWDILSIYVIPLAVIFGLLVGSFLNVVIYRVPVMMEKEWTLFAKEHLGQELSDQEKLPFNLIKPNSRCPSCHTPIRAWQNIPVISYLFLGGRCAHCKAKISKRYPLIELLTAILFGLVAWQYGWSLTTLAGLVFTAILLALTFIDMDTQYLPDQITLPLLWLGLLFNINSGLVSLSSAVLGAIVGYMSLWLLSFLYKLATGKIGMGGGDFKLFAALGAWFGLSMLPIIIAVAAMLGIIIALLMNIARGQQFAFGPSLAIAGWIIFIVNDKAIQAMQWWLHMSGF